MIEPMSVCELEFGRPKYQVPRFQMIAAISQEIKEAGPDHSEVRRHRVGVDHGRDRVGRIVEAIDEFEAERDQQRHAQQDERQRRAFLYR